MPYKNLEQAKENKRQYYIKNREALRKKNLKYRLENRDKIIKHMKKYNEKHKEQHKQYRLNNEDKIKKYRDNYRENHKEYFRQYNKNNPDASLKSHIKHLKKLGKFFDMNSSEYSWAIQSWSETVRNLDNHMCKSCDSTENLHAHHIMPKKDFPKLSLDLDNGVTLCKICHNTLHSHHQGYI